MASSEAPQGMPDLIERFAPSLHRFAQALLAGRGRPDAADELLQTALGRLRPSPGDGDAGLKVALYAAVVLAHRARQSTFSQLADTTRRIGRGGVAQLVEHLPLDQREVLLLVVLERLTYDEVAAVLGLPRASIVARLVRARASLALSSDDVSSRTTHLRVVK